MASIDTAAGDGVARDVAATCRDAPFVAMVVRTGGDAIAAAGLLARACTAIDTPYHTHPVRTRAELDAALEAESDDAATLVVGASADDGTPAVGGDHPSATAFDAAKELDVDPDPVVALAGLVAGEAVPAQSHPDLLERAGLERRPGLVSPTTDPSDGLAHSTWAHAAFSGDPEAARSALGEIEDGRGLASLLAVATVGDADASTRAGTAIGRAIRPFVTDGPFASLGGYADVLAATAHQAPGLGLAITLGGADPADALEAWRAHARATHEAVRTSTTNRHAGLLVARVEGPVETTARLLRDFRSPEPVVLAVGEGEAAVAAVDGPVADPLSAAAAAAGGSSLATPAAGFARFDAARADAFVAAFVEAFE